MAPASTVASGGHPQTSSSGCTVKAVRSLSVTMGDRCRIPIDARVAISAYSAHCGLACTTVDVTDVSLQVPYAPRPSGPGAYAPRPTATARPAPQQPTLSAHAAPRPSSGVRGAYSSASGGYSAASQPSRGDAPRGNGYASARVADPSAGYSAPRGPAPARGAGMASGRGGRGVPGRGSSQNMTRCA